MIDLNDVPVAQVRYDLDAIAARLRDSAHAWVPGLFPHGRRQGDEWRLANIRGDAPRASGSCVISLEGEHAGSWHDFDGDQGGGVLSTLEHSTGLSGRALFAHAADMTGWSSAPPVRQEPPLPPKPDRDQTREIAFIIDHAAPLAGTPAEAYLHQRGVVVSEDADLRYHSDLTHWETRAGFPAMVGIVRSREGQVIAVHRTYLATAGDGSSTVSKAAVAKPRMMLGKSSGGAVRLAPIAANGVLALSEGIETGLAAMTGCPGLAVWATLSTSGLEQVQLPPEAQRIIILADHDKSGAGARAADAAAAIFRGQGRKVAIAMSPHPGEDINDLLRRAGPQAVVDLISNATTLTPATAEPSPPLTGRHQPLGFVEPPSPKRTMRADDGDLDGATRRCWMLVHGSNVSPWLFRLGGEPTWVVPDDEGRPVTVSVRDDRMRHMLARLADWRRAGPNETLVPAPPPIGVIKSLVATPDPALPVLAGIVTAPVFGRGGVLLTTPGYHPDARLLYCPPPGFDLPPIPDRPSEQDIAAARTLLLDDLLGDFPFVGAAERAHVLALLLLGFVRSMINGSTPLHLIEKPTPGTGATLMVDAIAMILTGSGTAVMTEGRDEDEWRKRITAKLRQLPTLLLIDNLREQLDSSALAAALTAPIWEDRILGVSDMIRLPIRCVWVATGNNPTFSNEIARRLIRIRLDAHTDQPWRRKSFRHTDLMGWVQANRGALVAACLTLCQAWIAAGRPRGERCIGGFEAWAQTLGGILSIAGVEGFLGNLDEVMEASDTEGGAWRGFVQMWWDRFGTAEVGVADLYDLAIRAEPPIDVGDGNERAQRTRFGTTLRKVRDRVFQLPYRRVRIECGRVVHQARRWRLGVLPPVEMAPDDLDTSTEGNLGVMRGTSITEVPLGNSQSRTAKWEPGEPREPFSTLTHAHVHACTHEPGEAGKGSPGSQGSPDVEKHRDFAGEPTWEPQNGGSHTATPPSWLDGVP